ncbi:MAG: Asp-tRNA(Asn)/Glu-tRNA(Gln) amidotransferase subunit GatB [Chloroflexi bacterium]|nr:Asp-tRNA(Asn)/Glu-tRNA(Gln) amidotransferase subunit GatB [Chloroflexota bacterium]
MEYETVIGLEVHAQLLTKSKMFCSDSAEYANAAPNTHVCPICLGMPGVLPVINQTAVEYSVMTALALNCTIPGFTKFDRKNYHYPDLMKGYQISQYDLPLSRNGWLYIEAAGHRKRIGVTRVHLEEDTARLLHRAEAWDETYSLVDVNRSGVPLMEIVGEPDLRSPEEARQYLVKLRCILQYLGVSTGSMEEGSFRCDANISIRPVGSEEFGAKVEVKNMNSFRAVYRAMEYEARRQREAVESGGRIVQETRGWVEEKGVTVSQRTKEYAHDYRYFPEPDLPPMKMAPAWVESIRVRLPELPDARRDRFMSQFGLTLYDASLLTTSRSMADFFEACVQEAAAGEKGKQAEKKAKSVSNWLLGEFTRLLNETDTEESQSKVTPVHLASMLDLMEKGAISSKIAKTVFEEVFHTGKLPDQIVAEKGLVQISAVGELESVIDRVLAESAPAVADFRAGKAQALTYLVGQVMKATRGKADPAVTNRLLREKLEG